MLLLNFTLEATCYSNDFKYIKLVYIAIVTDSCIKYFLEKNGAHEFSCLTIMKFISMFIHIEQQSL